MELGPTTREQHNPLRGENTGTGHLRGRNGRLGRSGSFAREGNGLGIPPGESTQVLGHPWRREEIVLGHGNVAKITSSVVGSKGWGTELKHYALRHQSPGQGEAPPQMRMELVFAQTVLLAHPWLCHHTELHLWEMVTLVLLLRGEGKVLKAPCRHVAWKNNATQHISPVWTVWLWIRPLSWCKSAWLWHLTGRGDSHRLRDLALSLLCQFQAGSISVAT